MKKAISNRNRIADCLSQAADATKDAELRRRLRALEREVMRDQTETSDERTDGELLELAQSVIGYARARAGSIKQQIRLYENQIDAHFQALMNNQRYLQLIDNGLAMKNLSALVPDPAEADAILEKLTVHVEEWQDKQESFSDVITSYGNRVGSTSGVLDAADDEFDRAVSELRADADAKQPEPEREKKVPARPMSAEARTVAQEVTPVERGEGAEESVEEEPEHVDP